MASTTGKRFSLLRFSLRSLFVLVTVICIFLGYELEWIRQRRAFAKQKAVKLYITRRIQPPSLFGLFGETGYSMVDLLFSTNEIIVEPTGELSVSKSHPLFVRARALFPEARIFAWKSDGADNPVVVIK